MEQEGASTLKERNKTCKTGEVESSGSLRQNTADNTEW